MGKIKVLAPDVADRLRAGEFIERPAAAVKELMENSLDAGARHIKVEVKKGGKAFISVSDDGEGMGREDAFLSLERHATSKISSGDDLLGIGTLGFRGEALPSIASVSELTLTTAPAGAQEGFRVEARAGSVTGSRPAAARGTTVEVRDLFFNTPARKKFLKSEASENLQVINTVTRQALAHPKTGFSLYTDNQMCMDLHPAGDERERIAQVYGTGFLEGLAEAEAEEAGLKLRIFFSREGNWRGTRSHQFIFVNGRPVKDALGHAVYAAQEGLPAGRHPVFFIYLSADPRIVDVNVHPQKQEVHFAGRDRIFRFIMGAVKAAMRSVKPAGEISSRANVPAGGAGTVLAGENAAVYEKGACAFEAASTPDLIPASGRKSRPFIRLGQMFYAYSDGRGVILVDQHAAHERVMYERLLKNIGTSSGQFLFPLCIELSPAERQAVLGHRELLLELGFEVDEFGGGSVILRSAPEEFLKKGSVDYANLVADTALGLLEDKEGEVSELKKRLAARLACHSSVRGSEVLSEAEFERLLEDLEGCEDPEHCPHGRPTRLRLDSDELKKMFRRK